MDALAGSVFDNKYELLSLVGSGGMGRIYAARQIGLERTVAVKILDPLLVADDESVVRFQREARSISLLNHEHIASFYSYGIHDGKIPYIAMEFLDGKNLMEEIQRSESGLDWKRAVSIARQICQAMSSAHQNGVIHRDLKPQNIILMDTPAPDYVKVVDFGLAKLVEVSESGKQRLTRTGELIGSVNYLSPEQCQGRPADARSDVYSLACILFEMLTKRTPFESDNPIAQLHKHTNEQAPSINEISEKEFPRGLALLLDKALSKSPDERQQSMAEMEGNLKTVFEDRGYELEGTIKKVRKAKKPSKQAALLAVAAGVIAVCGASALFWYSFTDAGIAFQARSSLDQKPTDENRLRWLADADKYAARGEDTRANLIITEAAHSIPAADDKSSFLVAKLFIERGKKYVAEGNKELAGKWGNLALEKMSSGYEKPPADPPPDMKRNILYLNTIDQAAKLALLRESKYTKSEAKWLDRFARPLINVPGPHCFNLSALEERAFLESRLPASEHLCEVLYQRIVLLTGRDNIRELLRVLPQTIKFHNQFYGPNSAVVITMYSSIANGISHHSPEKARELLKLAEQAYLSCPVKEDNRHLEEGLVEVSEAYAELNDFKKAEINARQLIKIACARIVECGRCAQAHQVLSKILMEGGQNEEAFSTALRSCKLYRRIVEVKDEAPLYCKSLTLLLKLAKNPEQVKLAEQEIKAAEAEIGNTPELEAVKAKLKLKSN